jgi:hypothetical protein
MAVEKGYQNRSPRYFQDKHSQWMASARWNTCSLHCTVWDRLDEQFPQQWFGRQWTIEMATNIPWPYISRRLPVGSSKSQAKVNAVKVYNNTILHCVDLAFGKLFPPGEDSMIHKIMKYHQKLMKHVQWMPAYYLQRADLTQQRGWRRQEEMEWSTAYFEVGNKESKPFEDKACLNHLVLIYTERHMILKKLIGNIPQHVLYS